MVSERPSVEDFLQRSFGVCLLYDETIVGFCLSEYNCAGRCEVGVWTAESHRQRGLGKLMSLALVEQALQRGLSEVGWHCWADNLPSAALALSAGFVLQREYPVYVYLLEV
jgi:RimJ/RimL family protein N-acetyltransferase